MLTAASALALFLMLALASVVYYISNRFKLPYTVLLTLLGVSLVPLSHFEVFHFIREFQLTPELLFFIFLPTLLFESAYNMNIRRVVEEIQPILLLAVFGYLASAFLIGGGLWLGLDLLGLTVPFAVTLLFGALISATDPVAVLSLFKEYGAPRRLTLIFEGESLANDATALALFVVVLGLVEAGFTTNGMALGGATFVIMLVGGAILGLLVGAVLVNLIGIFRKNEVVAVTLMIVLAHLTFLVAELANESLHGTQFGFIQFSPIIATTAASLLMGNYGRFKVSPKAEHFVDKFWEQFAFMANSIVFILVGLLFASIPRGAEALIPIVLLTIFVVAVSRAISIYGLVIPFNLFVTATRQIPLAWMHLLAWGSLRGALAVMIVLLIPPDLAIPGWTLNLSVQQFLLVLTVACIFTTLFIKAPTIAPLMRRLKVDALTDLEKASEVEAQALIHGAAGLKLNAFEEKGYVPSVVASGMRSSITESFHNASRMARRENADVRKALSLYIIGLEKNILNELYTFEEITERVFKRIYGKLTLQSEAIQTGDEPNQSAFRDSKDIFENIAEPLHALIHGKDEKQETTEEFLYYRAQQILARKVVKELTAFKHDFPTPVFSEAALINEIERYEAYREEAAKKVDQIRALHPHIIQSVDEALAFKSLFRVKDRYLERYYHRSLLTPKLYIKLKKEYEEEVAAHEARP